MDDFALACTNEALADTICDIIGKKLQLPNEEKPLFLKKGSMSNFNGINVSQTDTCVELSCAAHINWLVTGHGWKEDKQIKDIAKTLPPLNTEARFGCRTLPGKMMHAPFTCRPNTGCGHISETQDV